MFFEMSLVIIRFHMLTYVYLDIWRFFTIWTALDFPMHSV